MTTADTICQGQFKPDAYKEDRKCIVLTSDYLQVAPSLNFNEQNASHHFKNIEKAVSWMHKSGMLGKLQEQYD